MKTFSSILDSKRHYFVFASMLCLCILAYRGSLSAPFYLDDYLRISENFLIKHFDLPQLWNHDPSRFVTNLSFNLNYLLVRFDLRVWHVINFILHTLNAFLVYRLTLLTFQTPVFLSRYPRNDQILIAVGTSLIFLLHPVQTQAVIYLVQRSTLLYSLFYLWTIYFYARAKIEGNGKFYVAAIATAFVGVFTKPSFLTLPLAIALYDLCFFGFSKKRAIKDSVIYLVLALPLLVIPLITWNKGILAKDAVEALLKGDFTVHFWTYFNVLLTFLRLLVLPVNLNLDYDYPLARSFFDFHTPFSVAAVMGLGFVGIRVFKKEPWITFCIFWFFIALGAHNALFPLADQIFEHWVYLSCYGFSLGLTLLLTRICRTRQILITVIGLLLLAMFGLTSQRSQLWGDSFAFQNYSVTKSPNKARVWHNLGVSYGRQNRHTEAKQAFEKARTLDPKYTLAQINLVEVCITLEQYDEAKFILQQIFQSDPNTVEVNFEMGRLYTVEGDNDKALFYFKQARSLNSYYPRVRMALGNVYEKKGDFKAAKSEMSAALWLDPENATLYFNLGNINFRLNNFYEAMINYTEAIRLRPHFTEALNNLGHIYFHFQDYKKASEQYEKAINFAPDQPEAYYHLANVLYEVGQVSGSKSVITTAIRLYRQEGKNEVADSLQKKIDALAK